MLKQQAVALLAPTMYERDVTIKARHFYSENANSANLSRITKKKHNTMPLNITELAVYWVCFTVCLFSQIKMGLNILLWMNIVVFKWLLFFFLYFLNFCCDSALGLTILHYSLHWSGTTSKPPTAEVNNLDYIITMAQMTCKQLVPDGVFKQKIWVRIWATVKTVSDSEELWGVFLGWNAVWSHRRVTVMQSAKKPQCRL